MANRFFQQFQGSLQKKVVTLYAKVDFDGSGVATVDTSETLLAASNPTTINPSSGFVGETITPVDIGGGTYTYTLKLQDPYVRLLSVTAMMAKNGVSNPTSLPVGVSVLVDAVNDNTTPALTLVFTVVAPPSTVTFGGKPATGTVLLRVDLSNTTAP